MPSFFEPPWTHIQYTTVSLRKRRLSEQHLDCYCWCYYLHLQILFLVWARGSTITSTTGQHEEIKAKGPLSPSQKQKFSLEKVLPGKKLRFKEGNALGLGHIVIGDPRAYRQSQVLPHAHSQPWAQLSSWTLEIPSSCFWLCTCSWLYDRYSLFLPLHELWKQYIHDLCNGLKPDTWVYFWSLPWD